LGDLSANSISQTNITIRNNEKETIILKKARSSCSCTTIKYEKDKQILPNNDYTIELITNTKTIHKGPFKKFIFFYFKNSKPSIIALETLGKVL